MSPFLHASRSRLALCVAGVLLCVSGANAGLLSDDDARRQIQTERARVDDLQKQAQDLNDRLGKVEETVKSEALIDLFAQIEALKVQVNNLRGQIEVLNNDIEGAAKRQRDMYVDLDTRLRALEQPAATTGAAAVPAVPAPTTAAPTVATAPTSTAATPVLPTMSLKEDAAYEAAHVLRRNRDYPNAIAAFQNFIKQYPKSGLAPRAQYWIGDSYYNLRDLKSAIAAQQALIANYPDSPSVPDAMLNIATAQQDAGDAANAKKTLQDLVAKYPISDAGQKAKRRLDPSGGAAFSTAPAPAATPVTTVPAR